MKLLGPLKASGVQKGLLWLVGPQISPRLLWTGNYSAYSSPVVILGPDCFPGLMESCFTVCSILFSQRLKGILTQIFVNLRTVSTLPYKFQPCCWTPWASCAPFPCTAFRKVPLGRSWGSPHMLVISLRIHWPELLIVQCQKTVIFYILPSILLAYGGNASHTGKSIMARVSFVF